MFVINSSAPPPPPPVCTTILNSKNCVTLLKLDLVISRLPCIDVRSYSCTFSAGGKGVLFSLCYSSATWHHVPVLITQWLGLWSKGDVYIICSTEQCLFYRHTYGGRVILLLSLHETFTDCGFAADLKMIGFFSSGGFLGFFFGIVSYYVCCKTSPYFPTSLIKSPFPSRC